MGVDYSAYLQLGVKFNGIPDLAVELQELDCDLVVIDGMCGDYSIIGPIIASGDMYGDGEFITLDTSQCALDGLWKDYKEKFIKAAGVDKWDDSWVPKLMFYVHVW